jgi:hypothetical protein
VLEAATAGLPIVIKDLECYREWLGEGYLSGTTVDEYSEHLRRLAQPDFRELQGGRASQAAMGYGFQSLSTEIKGTFDLAVQHTRHDIQAPAI